MTEFDIINLSKPSYFCTNCNKDIAIFQPAFNIINACPKCFTIHSKKDFSKYLKIKNNWNVKRAKLPLQTSGKINDLEIKIIGIALKTDNTEKWVEYQLLDQFNENHIITEWRGHYHYLKQADKSSLEVNSLSTDYNINKNQFNFKNKLFEKLSYYHTSTLTLIGEFPYDTIDISKIKCIDYVAPPHLISVEIDDKIPTFYIGRYLQIKEVREIFKNIKIDSPDTSYVGMAQPFAKGLNIRKINHFFLYFLLIFTTFHIIYNSFISENIFVNTNNEAKAGVFVSPSFILKNRPSNYYLSFEGNSSLDNQWIEDQITLVNEKTGEEREFSLGIEYYSGIDGGYSWSEGSTSTEVNISDVQPGKYHIKEKLISSSPDELLSFNLTGKTSTPSSWNYGLFLTLILVSLFLLNILKNNFETKRMP